MNREPIIILEIIKVAAALAVLIFVELPTEIKVAIVAAIIGSGTLLQRNRVTPVNDSSLPLSKRR